VDNALMFLKEVYGVFGFHFELELSTRPEEKYLGEIAVWDRAEAQLEEALTRFVQNCNAELAAEEKTQDDKEQRKMSWKLNPGDGAFYGPKIDIKVFDSLGREHQCATIQLDFQLPLRFGLTYSAKGEGGGKGGDHKKGKKKKAKEAEEVKQSGDESELEWLQRKYLSTHSAKSGQFETPVIIHRAIYGSFERFIAVLSEHLLGKWPFWISPRQIMVVPVTGKYNEYAQRVGAVFDAKGYWVEVDDSRDRLNNKIRKAQTAQYNFILVVGEKEEKNETVNIRTRDNKEHGEKSLDDTLKWFEELCSSYQ